MTVRILLLGGNGLLGTQIDREFSNNPSFDLHTISRKNYDLTHNKWHSVLNDKFDFIINCAALTNVDYCEQHIAASKAVNVGILETVLNSPAGRTAKVIQCSSTGVYGHANEGLAHTEQSPCFPTTIHHKHKLEAEKIVLESDNQNVCLRIGWLYGDMARQDFIFKINRQLRENTSKLIYSNAQQLGSPTNVRCLAANIKTLILSGFGGIINTVDTGINVTRYDYVKKIVQKIAPDVKVMAADACHFPRSASVSLNEAADNSSLRTLLGETVRNWEHNLEEYLNEFFKK